MSSIEDKEITIDYTIDFVRFSLENPLLCEVTRKQSYYQKGTLEIIEDGKETSETD